MSQPVVDTLQLSNALRKTGMEREQAEGVAGALGKELGAHVVVQGDLQSGFQQVRNDLGSEIQQVRSELGSEIQQVRSDLGQKIQAVEAKVEVLRAELSGRMEGMEGRLDGRMDGMEGRLDGIDRKIDAVNWKLTFMFAGLGLLLSVLTVVSGMGIFERTPVGSHPVSEAAFPSPPVAPHTPQAPLASGAD